MPCEGAQEVSGLQVPQLDCVIKTVTGKGLSIGTHGYTHNLAFMPCEGAQEVSGLQGAQEVSGLQVPQLDCLIFTATGKHLSIGTHCYTPNGAFMPCEVA